LRRRNHATDLILPPGAAPCARLRQGYFRGLIPVEPPDVSGAT